MAKQTGRPPSHGASTSGPRDGKPWKDPLLPDIDALVTATVAAHPWLDRPEFRDSVRAWARAAVRIDRVEAWLDSVGLLDGHGRPRPATKLLLTLEASAARARTALGFDPASFATIRKTVVEADSAQLALDAGVSRGREVFAARAPAIEVGTAEVVDDEAASDE